MCTREGAWVTLSTGSTSVLCVLTGKHCCRAQQASGNFFQSYLKMFPKSVSTASQNVWYFVMPQTLTLTDTRNPTGSFIHFQWKHDVFNSKDVSVTFRDFFHFGTAVLWQIAKERNSVVTAWFCRMLKPFCPGLCVPSPYPEQLSITQDYSAFCSLEPFLPTWPCHQHFYFYFYFYFCGNELKQMPFSEGTQPFCLGKGLVVL